MARPLPPPPAATPHHGLKHLVFEGRTLKYRVTRRNSSGSYEKYASPSISRMLGALLLLLLLRLDGLERLSEVGKKTGRFGYSTNILSQLASQSDLR